MALDRWDGDVSYSGTQKCLGCPPAWPLSRWGKRAEEVLSNRKTPVQSWYLDMSLLKSYWSDRAYHHTAPISMIYGLREGLRVVLEEGLRIALPGTSAMRRLCAPVYRRLGMKLFADEDSRLPTLTTVWVPEGIDEAKLRRSLLFDYNIEIGGGLGPVAGRIWRIGLMGENSKPSSVLTVLSALEQLLGKEGYEVARAKALPPPSGRCRLGDAGHVAAATFSLHSTDIHQ